LKSLGGSEALQRIILEEPSEQLIPFLAERGKWRLTAGGTGVIDGTVIPFFKI
jgi:hypothetical protein